MAAAILAVDTTNIVGASITALLTLAAVWLANRLLKSRGRKVVHALGGELSPVVDTRVRFLRRAIEATIVIIGVALALAQFTALDKLASAVLASGAIVAAVVGFASRQVLANAIAGFVITITQPVRIGDVVTFEDDTGVVEDVTLTYTWLRTGSGARIVVPNERLASGKLRNDSIRSGVVALEIAVWLAPAADEAEALAAIEALEDVQGARLADITENGALKVVVSGPPVAPTERLAREAVLRAQVLAALRAASVPRAGMNVD
jgi:small-conductance mechanosensitive channel